MNLIKRFFRSLYDTLDCPDITEDYRSNERREKKHYCPFCGYSGTGEDIRIHLLNRHRK